MQRRTSRRRPGGISPGSEGFCLLTETLISQVIENLRDYDVAIEERPVTRSGAVGTLEPVYFRDPVRNPVEVMEVVG